MTCREFADFIMDYLSDELGSDVRAEFDRHLLACANCRRYLTSYRESVKIGKLAFRDGSASVPPTVPEELVRAILAARSRSTP